MRRFLRISFNALTVLSLVLAVGVAGMWVRSYMRCDTAKRNAVNDLLCIESGDGFLAAGRAINMDTDLESPTRRPTWTFTSGPATTTETNYVASVTGLKNFPNTWFYLSPDVGFVRAPLSNEMALEGAYLAWWFVTFAFSILPAVRFVAAVWRRRPWRPRDRSFCRHCNYDLRATPERCPECGAVAKGAGG